MALRSFSSASETGTVLIQLIKGLPFARILPKICDGSKLHARRYVCQVPGFQPVAWSGIREFPDAEDRVMSFMVWKLMRRLPRPALLIVVLFVLTSLAKA